MLKHEIFSDFENRYKSDFKLNLMKIPKVKEFCHAIMFGICAAAMVSDKKKYFLCYKKKVQTTPSGEDEMCSVYIFTRTRSHLRRHLNWSKRVKAYQSVKSFFSYHRVSLSTARAIKLCAKKVNSQCDKATAKCW